MDASDYVKHRPLMFSIAYRMTGSVSDAEDIVQEAEGCVVNVFALDIADGLVQVVRSVANPGKLRHLDPTSDLALASRRDLTCRSWPPTSPRKPPPPRSSRASQTRRTRGCASY